LTQTGASLAWVAAAIFETYNSPPLSHLESPISGLRDGVLTVPGLTPLHHGGQIRDLTIGWSLSGRQGLPVVLALGGISATRKVFDPRDPREGWWREIVGPGKALDTDRVAILGMDYLGGSGASTGPAAGADFPSISSYDQADAALRLLDHLRIDKVAAIVGASYGGMVALAFGERYAARVGRLVVISAADMPHPMATAWRSVQRNIARLGVAAGRPGEGLELARALAMSTYRSPEEFVARFRGAPRREDNRYVFPVEEYLSARGRDYAARNRPESFICLSESIDLHQVEAARVTVRTEVIAVREDQLVPLADMRAMTARLPDARLHEFSSLLGHDAFLKEADQLRSLLATVSGDLS
jgi:homoserine O-acetyltransferase